MGPAPGRAPSRRNVDGTVHPMGAKHQTSVSQNAPTPMSSAMPIDPGFVSRCHRTVTKVVTSNAVDRRRVVE